MVFFCFCVCFFVGFFQIEAKTVARGVLSTSSTHDALVHDLTHLREMAAPTATVLR